MTWQQVTIVLVFVAGGCVLGALGKEQLAGTILGAAAGFVGRQLLPDSSRGS